jgi:hypothetical protein
MAAHTSTLTETQKSKVIELFGPFAAMGKAAAEKGVSLPAVPPMDPDARKHLTPRDVSKKHATRIATCEDTPSRHHATSMPYDPSSP